MGRDETSMCGCPARTRYLGPGLQPSNPLVRRPVLNLLSHTSQGSIYSFETREFHVKNLLNFWFFKKKIKTNPLLPVKHVYWKRLWPQHAYFRFEKDYKEMKNATANSRVLNVTKWYYLRSSQALKSKPGVWEQNKGRKWDVLKIMTHI